MEAANSTELTSAPLAATPALVETPQTSAFSADTSVPSAEPTAVAKAEPATQETETEEPRYTVDSGVSEEELAQSIKSINDFSVELERMRERMQKRHTKH